MEAKMEDRINRVVKSRLEGFICKDCLTGSPLTACGDDGVEFIYGHDGVVWYILYN
jgi:hypothetical protein